jgi:Alanine dehydrogenase/PNT, N-terminal domain
MDSAWQGGVEVGLSVGVVRETAPGERRVALVPATVGRLRAAGLRVLVEAGAGAGAWFSDEAYAEAGADVLATAALYAEADVLLSVGRLDPTATSRLRPGQTLIGMLAPLTDSGYAPGCSPRPGSRRCRAAAGPGIPAGDRVPGRTGAVRAAGRVAA